VKVGLCNILLRALFRLVRFNKLPLGDVALLLLFGEGLFLDKELRELILERTIYADRRTDIGATVVIFEPLCALPRRIGLYSYSLGVEIYP